MVVWLLFIGETLHDVYATEELAWQARYGLDLSDDSIYITYSKVVDELPKEAISNAR